MVLKAETKILRNPNAYTHYITIPSRMVNDSQYPFKDGEKVELVLIPNEGKLEIIKKGGRN